MGAGPALLKRRGKLETLFKTLGAWKKTTGLSIGAVGAKIRLGLNRLEQDQKVYLPVVELANEYLDYLTIHARHARQNSADKPTWGAIAEAKARSKIPIIGNGDIVSREDWERLSNQTGADGALIARGAIRSPWVFRELRGEGSASPTSEAELEAARAQYLALASRYGSKPKFQQWHQEGFRRMRSRLRSEADTGRARPPNEHMQ